MTFPFYDFKVSSSSQLKADTISYSADNVFDTSYKTAWIEGVSGYGVGEFVVIEIPSDNPITSLVFVTGFARSKELWLDNSRPKTIEMFVNEQPFATLTLRDARQEQCFQLNENNWHQFTSETWIIKFIITDVYEGKHDHTAITAIYLGNCK